MILLPSSVRDCHQGQSTQKMLASTMSVNSTVSASSIRKPSSKRPKKDVSVSFKQMTDTDDGEEESVKMDNDSVHEPQETRNKPSENADDKNFNDEESSAAANEEDKEKSY